jgi:hypothetical protein
MFHSLFILSRILTLSALLHSETKDLWHDESLGYLYALANQSLRSRTVSELALSGNEIGMIFECWEERRSK